MKKKITKNIKADVMKDLIPDAKKIVVKYNERQIDLLFAFVKAIRTKSIK